MHVHDSPRKGDIGMEVYRGESSARDRCSGHFIDSGFSLVGPAVRSTDVYGAGKDVCRCSAALGHHCSWVNVVGKITHSCCSRFFAEISILACNYIVGFSPVFCWKWGYFLFIKDHYARDFHCFLVSSFKIMSVFQNWVQSQLERSLPNKASTKRKTRKR